MSIRSVIVVILAVVCGGAAAIGVSQVIGRQEPPVVEVETVDVVVAKDDISRGQMLTERMVAVRQWPKEMAPAGTIRQVSDALERSVLQPIVAGEPLFDAKLVAREAGRGMAALIPKGMRAYTVQTSRVASNVAGFILPGNRVDVLLTLRGSPNDASGGGSTTTLLQAVEILAVGSLIDAPAENQVNSKEVESVTLLVSPEQAARLDLGQAVGQLTLSLRNEDDLGESETRPATLADIRFSQMKPQTATDASSAAPPADPVPQIDEVRRRPVPRIRTLRGQSWGEVRLVPAGAQ